MFNYKGAKPVKTDYEYDSRKDVGCGDYYGIGVTQPYGKERQSYTSPKMASPKGVHVMVSAPKKLA